MRYCIQSEDEETLFGAARGCPEFEQRLLRFDGPGATGSSVDDEVVYVLRGRGAATVGGEHVELGPGTALYVAAGTHWSVDDAADLELLSVLVRDPLPANGADHAIVEIEAVEAGEATAGRMFRLLAPCPSATQFVGYIPPGRAPDHYHRYDEVVYVLEGTGMLHIGGESAELRPGSCIHLPAELVHSLENAGPGEMQVLGVFRPAGSPAEAYYPDGALAYEY
ncbi:MAG TPA: cupin domain-containing protein [Gaiellaceae bacterium]|jgi:mannose-6-phosphate isomerase-like protein (cupin superfamily)|nr:cupin domain-containing protein [Gaiellaceae bacterium]